MGNSTSIYSNKNGNLPIINYVIPETPEQQEKRYEEMFLKYYCYEYPNNTEKFKSILSNIAPNYCNIKGQNLFHLFVKDYKFNYYDHKYNIDYLQILFDYGVDIHKRDNFGKTPIFYAHNEHSISFLIKKGADLNIRDNSNKSLIYHFSKNGDIIKILKKYDPLYIDLVSLINYEDYSLDEILRVAILFQDKNKIRELLDTYPELINKSTNEMQHVLPLYVAISYELYDEFMILLEYGADINNNNIINLFAYKDSDIAIKMLHELFDRGLDINKTIIENPILNQCYAANSDKMIRIFLDKGADINKRTTYFEKITLRRPDHILTSDADALMYMTSFMPHNDIFRALFEYGADPNKKSKHGITPFMGLFISVFVEKKCKRTNPIKLDENWSADYYIKIRPTFVYDAREYLELIQLFLDNGADINIKGPDGHTALDFLVSSYHIPNHVKIQVILMLQEKTQFTILYPNTNIFIHNILNPNNTWDSDKYIDYSLI